MKKTVKLWVVLVVIIVTFFAGVAYSRNFIERKMAVKFNLSHASDSTTDNNIWAAEQQLYNEQLIKQRAEQCGDWLWWLSSACW